MIDKFMKIPLSQRLLVLGALVGIIALVFYFFFYSSTADSINKAQSQMKGLSKQIKELEDFKKSDVWKNRDKETQEYLDQLKILQKKLPLTANEDGFIAVLQAEADQAGVKIEKITPMKKDYSSIFLAIPFKMEVVGTFPQIVQYLKSLARMIDRPNEGRLINVTNLTVTGKSKSTKGVLAKPENTLTATFIATTFSQIPKDAKVPTKKKT